MIEQIDSLSCQNNHSNNPIVMVLTGQEFKGSERLLCQQCLINNRGQINGLTINSAIEKIQEVKNIAYNELNNYIEINNQFLDEILSLLQQIRTNVLSSLDQLNYFINNWKLESFKLIQSSQQYYFLAEIEKLHLPYDKIIELEKNQIVNEVRKTKEVYASKIANGIILLQNSLDKENHLKYIQEILQVNFEISINDKDDKQASSKAQNSFIMDQDEGLYIEQKQESVAQLSNLKVESQKSINDQQVNTQSVKKGKSIQYKIIKELNSIKQAYTLAFNYDDTIVACSIGNQIKLLKFDEDKLVDDKEILSGHDNNIQSITFSKKSNWFVSATCRGSMRIWKIKEKKGWFNSQKWECSKSFKFHTKFILFQILNQNEEQLISWGKDKTIDIFGVNQEQNTIALLYQLEKHICNIVYSVAINSDETQMVSCGDDKKIIIWEKDENKKWQFKYFVDSVIYDDGGRACFTADDTIVWCQRHQPYLNICKLENGKFQEKMNLRLQFKEILKENNFVDCTSFKAIYNKNRQMLFIKQNRYLYLIRNNQNQELEIETEPLTCGTMQFCGDISNNGKYIIIWSQKTREIIVYELTYEN